MTLAGQSPVKNLSRPPVQISCSTSAQLLLQLRDPTSQLRCRSVLPVDHNRHTVTELITSCRRSVICSYQSSQLRACHNSHCENSEAPVSSVCIPVRCHHVVLVWTYCCVSYQLNVSFSVACHTRRKQTLGKR